MKCCSLEYGRIQYNAYETDIGILNLSALRNGLSDTPSYIVNTPRCVLYTKSMKNILKK